MGYLNKKSYNSGQICYKNSFRQMIVSMEDILNFKKVSSIENGGH